MTLGNAAAARVRLIVWCRDCGRQVEPDPGEMAERYGAKITVHGLSAPGAAAMRLSSWSPGPSSGGVTDATGRRNNRTACGVSAAEDDAGDRISRQHLPQ